MHVGGLSTFYSHTRYTSSSHQTVVDTVSDQCSLFAALDRAHLTVPALVCTQAVRVDKIELAAESQSFHVHFGAGRLGLGLVLPALQGSKVPFAILQRPSREWAELGNAEWQDSIAVDINGALS